MAPKVAVQPTSPWRYSSGTELTPKSSAITEVDLAGANLQMNDGNIFGGDAAGDSLDIDPSDQTNYTGTIRICPNAGDYGGSSAVALDAWPNGLTVGAAALVSGFTTDSTITQDADGFLGLPAINLFFADFTHKGASSSVTIYGAVQAFIAQPKITNDTTASTKSGGFMFSANPLFDNENSSGSNAVSNTTANFRSQARFSETAGTTTCDLFTHFFARGIQNPTGSPVVTLEVCLDCGTVDAVVTTGVSLRSTDSSRQMRHAGPAVFGANAAPANTTDVVLEVQSTTGAFLLSRMTTTQRDAFTTEVDGMLIYNTTDNVVQARENGAWVDL